MPAIDKPRFVPADADFLSEDEPVFGLRYRGEVRAYPQQVLVWYDPDGRTRTAETVTAAIAAATGTAGT
ncbi:DUF3179 domain-containing (seleno)protein [Streptomyces sp. NPDC050164]|uniref:DUF3179 domain-containing (seleno)protein n=1 Tax=Streptomyces sp. NPDC050164 TaxID=3365605 RepID=UPI0037AC797E